MNVSRSVLPLGFVAIAVGAAVVIVPGFTALAIPATLGVMAVATLARALAQGPGEAGWLLRWTFASYVAHLAVGLLTTNYSQTVYEFFADDAGLYHTSAIALVDHWVHGTSIPWLGAGKEGFSYLLGALYWAFGPYTAAGLAMNATFAAGLVPIVTDIVRRTGSTAMRFVPPVLVFTPSFLIWPSQLLREASVLFFVAVTFNAAFRLSQRVTPGSVGAVAAGLACLFTLRAPVAVALAVGLVVAAFVGQKHLLRNILAHLGVTALLATLVLLLGLGYSGYQYVLNADLETASQLRVAGSYDANTAFDLDADISNPVRFAAYLPVGVVRFLIGPFPWEVEGLLETPGLVDAFISVMLLIFALRGLREAKVCLARVRTILFIPAAALTILFAPLLANYGLVLRERTQVMLLLVPLIVLGIEARHRANPAAAPRSSMVLPPPAQSLEQTR